MIDENEVKPEQEQKAEAIIPVVVNMPTFKQVKAKYPNLSEDEALMYYDGYRDGVRDMANLANTTRLMIKE